METAGPVKRTTDHDDDDDNYDDVTSDNGDGDDDADRLELAANPQTLTMTIKR